MTPRCRGLQLARGPYAGTDAQPRGALPRRPLGLGHSARHGGDVAEGDGAADLLAREDGPLVPLDKHADVAGARHGVLRPQGNVANLGIGTRCARVLFCYFIGVARSRGYALVPRDMGRGAVARFWMKNWEAGSLGAESSWQRK